MEERESTPMQPSGSRSQIWYVRRGSAVRGPYPPAQITRDILLGRIHNGDDLSQDRKIWRSYNQVPQLLPKELMYPDDPRFERKLMLARLREDERLRDRRAHEPATIMDNRRHGDRRNVESFEAVAPQERVAQWVDAESAGERNLIIPAGVTMTVALVLAMYFLWYRPAPRVPTVADRDCSAPAAPGVNWSNCAMAERDLSHANLRGANLGSITLSRAGLRGARLFETDLSYASLDEAVLAQAMLESANLTGAVLRKADLSAADLQNSNLSYAIFEGANLAGANLAGARFDHAVWTDGRLCGVDSIGTCR
jgi:hypothetical protein